ncbi:MAG: hypothetical protein IJ030_05960 [Oscillospiraceae bacterium]|nr:hypothetical protein [Oscillospiraceae bacterium]
MAKIKDIIDRVDENVPNAFSPEQKMAWISELDGKIGLDVMLLNILEVQKLQYKYPEDMESEPLITFPHESLYDLYLTAQIDFANRETDKYQNSITMYNAAYDNFVRWFVRTYDPAQGYRRCYNVVV